MGERGTFYKAYSDVFYKFLILTGVTVISVVLSYEGDGEHRVVTQAFYLTILLQSFSNLYDMTWYITSKKYNKKIVLAASVVSVISALCIIICIIAIASSYKIFYSKQDWLHMIIWSTLSIYPILLLYECVKYFLPNKVLSPQKHPRIINFPNGHKKYEM